MNIYREIPKLAREIANEYCDGRWIAVGGGGYDHWRVVPRAWALIWLEMNNIQNISGYLLQNGLKLGKDKQKQNFPTWEDPDNMYKPIPVNQKLKKKRINCSEIP